MDGKRFDAITRALGAGRSRRSAIGLLAAVAGLARSAASGSAQQFCGWQGESCENRPCCPGFSCSADLACISPAGWCGYEGESCENRPCCGGLACGGDLACVVPAGWCGYEGESCENRACCAGLDCSVDLACLPAW